MVVRSWHLQNFDVYVNFIEDKDTGYLQYDAIIQEFNRLGNLPNAGDIFHNKLVDKVFTKVNPALYTQCIRLYMPEGANDGQYCILGDADMFIGSSFLYRDLDKINVFGHDLTGYGEVPMCYVGMTREKWLEVMQYGTLEEDLEKHTKYKSSDWYEAWGADQQILTAKLKQYSQQGHISAEPINFITRGHDPRNDGLPLGRWDRHNWKRPATQVHDVHMLRNPLSEANYKKTLEMLYAVYPYENWNWVEEFKIKFFTTWNLI